MVAKIREIRTSHERILLGASSLTAFLAVWEIIGKSGLVNRLFLPPLSAVLKAGYDMFASGIIWVHIQVTATEFLLGFAIAVVIGVPLGILMGWKRKVNFVLDPLVSMIYAIPFLAVIPLIILWFGIGIISKLVTVVYVSVFPIVVNTMAGVKSADESLVRVGRSFGARDLKIFKTIVLPGAFPYLLSGLRLGLGRALVGAIGAELQASTEGLGWLIGKYSGTFQTDKMLVSILIVAAIGVALTEILKKIEARFEVWRIRF